MDLILHLVEGSSGIIDPILGSTDTSVLDPYEPFWGSKFKKIFFSLSFF